MLNSDKPNPGSKEAVKQGCTCAIWDNSYGKGIGGNGELNGWWINGACPLHGQQELLAEKAAEKAVDDEAS